MDKQPKEPKEPKDKLLMLKGKGGKGSKWKGKAEPHGTIQTNGNTSGHLEKVPLPRTSTGLHQQKIKVKGEKSTRQPTGVTSTRLTDTPQNDVLTTHTVQVANPLLRE